MEFLDINLTQDSSHQLNTRLEPFTPFGPIHSPFYWRILKKKIPHKKISETKILKSIHE
jgi:hypothetical protein